MLANKFLEPPTDYEALSAWRSASQAASGLHRSATRML